MYQIQDFKKDEYSITSDFSRIDIDAVISLLSKTYWAKARPKDVILKSLENSLCFSLFHLEKQIGLIRVITDYVTFAYLCDVIIDENYRHQGLGKWSLECVLKHPELIDIKRWCLFTADADEFYKKFGFEIFDNKSKFMIRLKK